MVKFSKFINLTKYIVEHIF